MHYLHPIFHSYSYHAGCRIDSENELPARLDNEDLELFIDFYSEPPRFVERVAPVTAQLGKELLKGHNWTDLMLKSYRVFSRVLDRVHSYIRQTLIDEFREPEAIPFMSMAIDPDTLHRLLQLDYESGESSYVKLVDLYSRGVVAPCLTTPFHCLLPQLDDFDVRLLTRIGLLFYGNMLEEYHHFLCDTHCEQEPTINFWLSEGAYSSRVMGIVYEEIKKEAKRRSLGDPHVVVMLDALQAGDHDRDLILKSWNLLEADNSANGKMSVVFRHRNFSDWVVRATPSVKKLIDRTIAKSNADFNNATINHCWPHFEEIESLSFAPKAIGNFEQKIIKLTELGYLSVSPDVFARRKLMNRFSRGEHEPQRVQVREHTACSDWHLNNLSLGRWEGVLDSNAEYKLVDENHPYFRITESGRIEEQGPQCWKIAYTQALQECARLVKGDPKELKDGVLGILASFVRSKDAKVVHRNVEDFLVHYAYIYWREHFLNQGFTEADTYLPQLIEDHLLRGCKKPLGEKETLIAGVAAQAYYFALDAFRSISTFWENFDQRCAYQNTLMMMLAMVNMIYVYRWLKKPAEEKRLVDAIRKELIGFANAYERYRLAEYGVTKVEWQDAIKSSVSESAANIVERVARRLAARFLRPLGYKKEFAAADANITTNTGHIWSREIEMANLRWENNMFCGIKEE